LHFFVHLVFSPTYLYVCLIIFSNDFLVDFCGGGGEFGGSNGNV
jgi:hypothetical protein